MTPYPEKHFFQLEKSKLKIFSFINTNYTGETDVHPFSKIEEEILRQETARCKSLVVKTEDSAILSFPIKRNLTDEEKELAFTNGSLVDFTFSC